MPQILFYCLFQTGSYITALKWLAVERPAFLLSSKDECSILLYISIV